MAAAARGEIPDLGAETPTRREAHHRPARNASGATPKEESRGALIFGRLSSMADALDELRALERRDTELSSFVGKLRMLEEEVDLIRERAGAIAAFFSSYPETENRLRKGITGAETELESRQRELAEARQIVAEAANVDARESAAREVDRARGHVSIAEGRLVRATDAYEDLERQASALPDELRDLVARAELVTRHLPHTDSPAGTPEGLVDWANRAHATLFVAVGQLDAQRDRIVREANELATMLLGEPTYGSTPTQALARVTAAERRPPQQ